MLPVWKENLVIRSFDVDCNNRLRISSLCSYFQEVAGHHAEHLGVGFHHLRQSGMAWVLSRLEVSFLRMPAWNESVTIETWPTGNERLYYRREFCVMGAAGEDLIRAVSFWLPINLQNRRPKMISLPADVIASNAGRFVMTAMEQDIPFLASAGMAETVTVKVQYGDIDVNQHVNNARYAGWISDFFPVEFHFSNLPQFFRLDIRHEVKANEAVEIMKIDTGEEFLLEGIITDNRKTCFRAVLQFSGESRS